MAEHIHSQTSPYTHDIVTANKAYFGHHAQRYDERPNAQELARRLASAMRKRHPSLFDEDATIMMDYACGTGLVSRELSPYVKSIVGVDISQAMVEQYNLRVSNQGLSPEEMKAVCVDLSLEHHELGDVRFDLIVCTMAYHHFPSIESVTKTLASFLKPGGSVLIADIYQGTAQTDIFPNNNVHVQEHIVAHQRGFDEDDIQSSLRTAGLKPQDFSIVTSGKMHGDRVDFFLARGDMPTIAQ